MSAPEVSVVMSVFNGAAHLPEAVESVLAQAAVDLEFVAVNDGSTDESPAILRQYAQRDSRLRIVDQENRGLTRALVRGCGEARGRYIARQDADDVSLPGRLRRQIDRIEARADTRLVSCWTAMIGPRGEELFVEERHETPDEATRSMRTVQARMVKGLGGHGSALFRRADYEAVGGYRAEFYLAQDLDLWLRLTDRGVVDFVPDVLYKARFTPSCLSTAFQAQQIALAHVALQLMRTRAAGEDEAPLLEEAALLRPKERSKLDSNGQRARGSYFIGRCLLDRGDPRAAGYLRTAVRYRPWDLKAWMALGGSWLQAVTGSVAAGSRS